MLKQKESEAGFFDRAGKNHPLRVLVYCVIAGIAVLFLSLTLLFSFYNPEIHFKRTDFPRAFIFSTLIIVAGSFTIEGAKRAYYRDDGAAQLKFLMITLGITLLFTVAQYFGWQEMWNAGITIISVGGAENKTPGGAFLYIISGLHFLHLAAGIIFLFLAMFKVTGIRGDDVRSVVYFSNAYERTRMEMLATYWHFLGGLWFLLFLYFLWFFV
ncbi:MAG TPA: cytochrome c oxidase subunit 3 [Bacteroidia bacterium]|nr:cytochrome c oxidase subunit 3 [Bacteroidia bacterium]